MRIVLILFVVSLLVVGVAYGAGKKHTDWGTVDKLDVERYMGRWYEIARLDNRFERGLSEVTADYRLLDNGRIEVINSGCNTRNDVRKTAHGKAHLGSVPGQLRVSFFWFFYSDYNVLELDPDYRWALVGSRSPKYLWILSRTPRLHVATLNHIIELARRRGYKTQQLLFVDQPAVQP